LGKTSLVLIAFAVISVLLTATAAWLAMHRPDVARLHVETRSRLAADYSVDAVARRLEPLDPDVIRAAAGDEAALAETPVSPEPPRRVAPADVTPVATAAPTSTPPPSPTVRGTATGTPRPGSTPTPKPGDPTATAAPGDTPQPTKTPDTNLTPKPSPTRPIATIDVPTLVPTIGVTVLPTLAPTKTPEPPTSTPTPRPPTSTPKPPTPTPTPAPTSIIGDILDALSCTLLGTIGSLPGGAQTTITFVNQSEETVKVYELPTLILGQPVLRATLGPGQQVTRSTQVGFAFEVTEVDGECIGIYRAQAGGGTAVID
jgi:hypothetical protein